ncbi:hypothetical protein CKAH01_14799 [Colletotrichum kahawae]|uniref:Uncharacterized protein n=1 Tax=Colletotrichum kahawae TaxID=34407 RepID=A0AAD9YLS6_COLKA|nr:hypothetical protein CKAH01_14799 [Colletotrichum kahawae]
MRTMYTDGPRQTVPKKLVALPVLGADNVRRWNPTGVLLSVGKVSVPGTFQQVRY